MSESYVDYLYRYPFASSLAAVTSGNELKLAASEQQNAFPHFFEGSLLQPRSTALMLFILSRIVSKRFYIPPNLLKRMLLERDPVITCGAEMLRFEGFSACCSAYARVDISPDAYRGRIFSQGTTNVDFNTAMRSALAMVRDDDRVSMSIGADGLELKHGFNKIEEKKVQLPMRWIKGFVEVQAYQSRMEQRFSVGRVESIRFLRSLPSSTNVKSSFYIIRSGKGLRISQRDDGSGVRVGGTERLLLLKDLVPLSDGLTVFARTDGEASEWRLDCAGVTFCLTLSSEPSRGFSGEGQVLNQLTSADTEKLSSVRSTLKWQSCVDIGEIARLNGMNEDAVKQTLSVLGSRGLVGFDLGKGTYFHRELPFDMELIEDMHPRLKNARKLVDSDGVKLKSRDLESFQLEVRGTDVQHTVKIFSSHSQCTCPWYSKYQGFRGPCKHILAAQIVVDGLPEQKANR